MGARSQEFSAGAIAILPVLIATAPIAVLFGTLAVAKGLSPFEVWLMSATVFAGALQFVAIDQWADPIPLGLLVFTALVVNVRHVLMTASLGRSMTGFSGPTRYAAMFFLSDEAWAFAERRARDASLTPAYYFGIGVSMWLVWTSSSLLGAMIGRGLGDPSAYGFNFAFSAVFICILVGFWSNWRTGVVLACSGGVSAVVYLFVPGAWYIMAGAFAGVAAAAALHAEIDEQKTDGVMPS